MNCPGSNTPAIVILHEGDAEEALLLAAKATLSAGYQRFTISNKNWRAVTKGGTVEVRIVMFVKHDEGANDTFDAESLVKEADGQSMRREAEIA